MADTAYRPAAEAIPYILDLSSDELVKLSETDGADDSDASAVLDAIFAKCSDYLDVSPAPAATPAFTQRETHYIRDLLTDEVNALDEMDDDERRDGAIETLSRTLAGLNRWLANAR